jgi:putative ABC transport system substrate-binding protein
MRRREFISLIGSAVAYPLTALAQADRPVPRVGVLTGNVETDLAAQARVKAFRQGLTDLGWAENDPSARYTLARTGP